MSSKNIYDKNSKTLISPLGQWRSLILKGLHSPAFIAAIPDTACHETTYQYNAKREIITQQFFDTRDKPCAGVDGFTKVEVTNNDVGLPVEYKATLATQRIVLFIVEYNPRRDVTRVAFLDENQRLINNQQGYAEIVLSYDPTNHKQTAVKYLNAEGETIR